MFKRFRPGILAFTCLLVIPAPEARSQTAGKKKVSNQSDLPRFTYPLTVTIWTAPAVGGVARHDVSTAFGSVPPK